MKSLLFSCVVILTCLGLSAPEVRAEQPLIWLTDNQEDILNYRANTSSTLSVDTTQLVLQSLEQYDIQYAAASVERINAQLRNTLNSCVRNRLRTQQRRNENVFSLPVNLHPQPVLFYRNSKIKIPPNVLDSNGRVLSLNVLLDANPGKQLLLVDGVNYGKQVDQLLASLPEKRITFLSVDNRYEAVARLFNRGFVDLVIEYPERFYDSIKSIPDKENISVLPFAQLPQFLTSYIACSNSELGKQVVADVNLALRNIYGTDAHFKAHAVHLPAATLASFEREYAQTFGSKKGVDLKVAVDHFPPWLINNPGHAPYGIDIDILELITSEMNVSLTYVDCPFSRCLRMLENGEVDLYTSMFRDKDREQYISFIDTPVSEQSHQALYLRESSPIVINNYDDMRGKNIGMLRGSDFFEKFDQDQGITKIPIVDNNTLVDMLLKKRIDVFIGNEAALDYIINERDLRSAIRKAKYRWSDERKSYMGISFRSAHAGLKSDIEKAVKHLRDEGAIRQVYLNWMECCGLFNNRQL